MTDETPRLVAAIVSSLSAATAGLFAWARHLATQQVKMLEKRVTEQEEQIDTLETKLSSEIEGRRDDAQTYARGIINLSHKFTQRLHEVILWIKRR